MLAVKETGAFSQALKPGISERDKVEVEKAQTLIDESKVLRDNWVPRKDHPNFTMKSLRVFLKSTTAYPDKFRSVIWTYLLSLPKNALSYDNLVKKGVHREYEKIEQLFPLKNPQMLHKLGRVLSSLAHYSPIFADKQITPFVAFPFVKLFSNDECLAFEFVATFFLHWGQHLFENYPQPSPTMIEYVRAA